MELGLSPTAMVQSTPVMVPGSVQKALLDAGLIPDWNVGLNARLCEWVENRHWIFEVAIPDEWMPPGKTCRLRCDGLDHNGVIRLNGEELYEFEGAWIPHVVDLGPQRRESGNFLQIIFEIPPRWLGTPGWSTRITEWKARFNYTWDWIERNVQIGIWDSVTLEVFDEAEIKTLDVMTDVDLDSGHGCLTVTGDLFAGPGYTLQMAVVSESARGAAVTLRDETIPADVFLAQGLTWDNLDVDLWWPNGDGAQPLYSLSVGLRDGDGELLDQVERRIGFKHIEWAACEDAPAGADPWLCVVNGRPVFLRGINWSPIRPNFADVPEPAYRLRLEQYRDLNMNTLRTNGCGIQDKQCFYDLCDELGLLVWHDFPLSSSGLDNHPPDDGQSIDSMAAIASSVVRRRRHHACMLCWCGGNELQMASDGSPGIGKPLDQSHPMLRRLAEVVTRLDPGRRFIATSPIGPHFTAEKSRFGKGLHWEVHGPWRLEGSAADFKREYWDHDDSLFRSEVGAPGPCDAELTRRYKGDCDDMPASLENPLWRRTSWWIEWDTFIEEQGREPATLEEYVEWGQKRQSEALRIAAEACVGRFPRIGGMLIWHGHDCFPCAANTALLDFEGNPKPAALAVGEVFGRLSRASS